jgi:hypothetical protein
MYFKQWCKINGFFSDYPISHLFMDGGKLYVPTHKIKEFYTKYIDSVNNGEKICLVEKLGQNVTFRFFLDVDFKRNNFHNSFSDILISANEVLNMNGDVYKCTENKGYHIIYNKVVNFNQAHSIFDNIVKKIENPECLDRSVYSTGLRMIGSTKFTNNNIEDRVYLSVTNPVITWDFFKYSVVRMKETIDVCPIIPKNQTFDLNFIKDYLIKLSPKYNDCTITGAKEFSKYICLSTNSKWCTNKGDYHKNAKVYFVVSPNNVMYQKCYCPCAIHRSHGMCRTYRSNNVTVSKQHIKQLQLYLHT